MERKNYLKMKIVIFLNENIIKSIDIDISDYLSNLREIIQLDNSLRFSLNDSICPIQHENKYMISSFLTGNSMTVVSGLIFIKLKKKLTLFRKL
jgi:hypothetical protein